MKSKSIFILVILFAGLVLISFYGTKLREGLTDSEGLTDRVTDNKETENAVINAKSIGSDKIHSGSSLYGPNGEICQVLVDQQNKQSLEVRDTINTSPVYYNFSEPDTFTGPNGAIAEVYLGTDNQPRIKITDNKGNAKVFAIDGSNSNSNDTQVSSPNYNPVVDKGFIGTPMGTNNYNSMYSSSLVTGIPANQIVPGTEDLYILKSQVVPQVCPACNNNSSNHLSNQSSSKKEMCPPCPACARCPEPSFECKKVPNYKSMDSQNLPFPILNDFTSFGM
jgi:hypothetical protein